MEKPAQMVRLTSSACEFIAAVDVPTNQVKTLGGEDIPQVFWPDGSVCWLVNLYLLECLKKGLSRLTKGGTLRTQAKHLSLFVRYCYLNRIDFLQISDSRFTMFVNTLKEEIHPKNPDKTRRTTNHLLTICSTVLNFMAYLDRRFEGNNLLGENGRIRATLVAKKVATAGFKVVERSSWTHSSFPAGSASVRRRQPIATDVIEKLHDANHRLKASEYRKRRRYIMMRLLQVTGGRRIEIAFIKTKDILDAINTGELRLFSAKKRRKDATRVVPVAETNLYDVLSFIRHHRQSIIRNTIGRSNDHEYLFVSERTGKPLKPDTLDSELKEIAKEANIDNAEICLHAFRHRFCTLLFRQYFRSRKYKSEAILLAEVLKDKAVMDQILQWTGHSSVTSLEVYVHHAWEEENGTINTNLNPFEAKVIADSLVEATNERLRRMENGEVLTLEDMRAFSKALEVGSSAFANLQEKPMEEKSVENNEDEEEFSGL